MIGNAVESGEVERFDEFFVVDEKARKKRQKVAERERKEVEKREKTMKAKSESQDLALALKRKGKDRLDALVDRLETKYGNGKKVKNTSKEEMLNDEEFEALQAKLFGDNVKKNGKPKAGKMKESVNSKTSKNKPVTPVEDEEEDDEDEDDDWEDDNEVDELED